MRNLRVPGAGVYVDDEWTFKVNRGGVTTVTVDWRIDNPARPEVTDAHWGALLGAAKWFAYTVLADPARAKPPKALTFKAMHRYLVHFVRWMVWRNYLTFSEFDALAAREFLNDLAAEKVDLDGKDALSMEAVRGYVDVPRRIFEQRDAMHPWPDTAMPDDPFDGRTVQAVACDIGKATEGWIPPVPDEFWLASVRTASAWIEGSARDVARLGQILLDAGDAGGVLGTDAIDAIRRADIDGSLHALVTREARRVDRRVVANLTNRSLQRLYKHLLLDLRDACTIVIQAMLGLRVGEVAGLEVGARDPRTGWPACLGVRPSRTGLNDLFFVSGHVFKGFDTPQGVEWVAGSRPAGTDYVPIVVNAILILEEAYRPWRTTAGLGGLIVDLGSPHALRWPPMARVVDGPSIAAGQKRFVATRVELPESVRHWKLSSHQWRKSFAIYMVTSDERHLAAVSDHFKHMTIAMTERGYVGADPTLLGLMDDVAVRTAARTIFEAVHGRVAVAGVAAAAILDAAPAIIREDDPHVGEEGAIDGLREAMMEADVRVYPSDWGRCLFRPETALCHREGGNAFDLSARRPLESRRHPGTCGRCPNLLVFEGHADFWRRREDENRAVVEAYEGDPDLGDIRFVAVALERIKTAERILKTLDAARAGRHGKA